MKLTPREELQYIKGKAESVRPFLELLKKINQSIGVIYYDRDDADTVGNECTSIAAEMANVLVDEYQKSEDNKARADELIKLIKSTE